MKVYIEKMESRHIAEIMEIEKLVFPSPWSKRFFFHELQSVYARSFVAILEDGITQRVVGYICSWVVHDECSINKIACHTSHQRMGIASMLFKNLLYETFLTGVRFFSLEVREFNTVAQLFYQKFKFIRTGKRKHYYSDTHEDAIVMELHITELPCWEERTRTVNL
jgi:ribosomal-protein-alanine N-acetyltransferase